MDWLMAISRLLQRLRPPWAAGRHRSDDRVALGRQGEKQACRYLKKQGYRLLRSNYRCDSGEVDLIFQDGPELVFVEVKTRRSEEYIRTEEVVNSPKQHHIRLAARYFIRRYKLQAYAPRFDIVAVIWPAGEPPQIRHTKRAFLLR